MKTFKDRQKLTEWNGAFKDRTINELRRDTCNQIKHLHERETGSRGTWGAKNTTKTVHDPYNIYFYMYVYVYVCLCV